MTLVAMLSPHPCLFRAASGQASVGEDPADQDWRSSCRSRVEDSNGVKREDLSRRDFVMLLENDCLPHTTCGTALLAGCVWVRVQYQRWAWLFVVPGEERSISQQQLLWEVHVGVRRTCQARRYTGWNYHEAGLHIVFCASKISCLAVPRTRHCAAGNAVARDTPRSHTRACRGNFGC